MIKKMSYEECREDFFVNLIKHSENKIKYWKRQTCYSCEKDEHLSQAGAEIQYCRDALQALAKQTPQKAKRDMFSDDGWHICPICGEAVHDAYNYCFNCGQKIDVSSALRCQGSDIK